MPTNGWMTGAAVALALATGLYAGGAVAGQSALLSNTDLRKAGATARTATQHRRLAAHYHLRAAELDADAKAHEAIAKAASQQKSNDDLWDLARDATHYAEHARDSAAAAMELANLHEAMATRSEQ